MPSQLTIVIVGGVAGGASAATRARRMNEQAEIILLEKDEYVSFANCGLPYYIGDEISDREKLLVATPEFLARRFRLDVRTRHEVRRIDRQTKRLRVFNHRTGTTYEQSYDKLILSPGAVPLVPPMEGADADNVFTLRNLADTDRIKAAISAGGCRRAVVVGAGYIGLEMVEQLAGRGLQVALAELQPQVLPLFDAEMVQPIEAELRARDVPLYLGDGIQRVLVQDQVACGIELASGTRIEADVVILGLGVRPQTQLAKEADLQIGPGGGIATNACLQTSDPDVYAVGDAAEYTYGPTGKSMRIALAGPANRAGRLAGEHAATGKCAPLADVFGTSIVRGFGQTAGLTGLTCRMAQRLQIPHRSVTIIANHHAGYYPGARPLTLKLVYHPQHGRVWGAQVVGSEGVDKRIDVIATAMALRGTVRDLAGLDLAYAPPFGAAKDPIHIAAFAACNQLDGISEYLDADADLDGWQVVDVRSTTEVESQPFPSVKDTINIPVDELRERVDEIDPHKPTVVSCATGLRAHLAARILRQRGFREAKNLSGGVLMRRRALPDSAEDA